MFGIGTGELLLLIVIALIVLGPERLPGLARDVGKAMSDLRRTSDELTTEFLRADHPTAQVSSGERPAEAPMPAESLAENAPSAGESASSASEHEPPSGEEPTAFDEEAQRRADEARTKADATKSWTIAEERPEPDRWG